MCQILHTKSLNLGNSEKHISHVKQKTKWLPFSKMAAILGLFFNMDSENTLKMVIQVPKFA